MDRHQFLGLLEEDYYQRVAAEYGDEIGIFETTCYVECAEPSNAIYDFNGTFYNDQNSTEFESLRL